MDNDPIQPTQNMIDEGAEALIQHLNTGEGPEEIATAIYRAMMQEKRRAMLQAARQAS